MKKSNVSYSENQRITKYVLGLPDTGYLPSGWKWGPVKAVLSVVEAGTFTRG